MSSQFIVSAVTILVIVHVMLISTAYLIMLERKIASWVQDRIGPNRTGFSFGQAWLPQFHFWGLGQPLADGLKFLLKEDYTPPFVDRVLFILAPLLVIVPALIAWAVMPWGGWWVSAGWDWPSWIPLLGGTTAAPFSVSVSTLPVNIGVIYILAIGSLSVYGVVVGGYASANKYSFLGGLRATAQMLSYEIPMGLAVLIVILIAGTAKPDLLVHQQVLGGWYIIYQPVLAIIFFTCILAECNRAPFDLAEAEQELVGGYHTEYSAMKFALFFLAEYMHMITGCAFFTLLFLGGWDVLPFVDDLPIVTGSFLVVLAKFGVFAFKIFLLLSLMMLIRWSLPRFRFDQLMQLAWRTLIPTSLVLLLLTGAIVFLSVRGTLTHGQWWMLGANVLALVLWLVVGPMLPAGPPVNRKVELPGSRFSAPKLEA